jgi:two-component system NtrC family sensor kinase
MREEPHRPGDPETRPSATGDVPFRAILDAIPTRLYYVGADGRFRYANQEYAGFLGLPASDILGRTGRELFGDAAWAEIGPLSDRAMAGETVRWEGWATFRAGERYTQRVYSPHREPDGTIAGYFVFVRDITELKLHERELVRRLEALRQSEAMKAAIIDSALDCVIMIDEQSRVIGFNPMAEKTFGYSAAQAMGRQIGDLIVPPHLRAQHEAGFRRYLTTGESTVLGKRIEIEAMRADGAIIPVELAITEVKTANARQFTAYLRDLTQARQAASEIERQREALHQSEKLAALGSMLAGVAHELNNPLSIVIGHALMLGEETREHVTEAGIARIAERAGKIQAAAERCGRIVRTFLSMARQGKAQRQEVQLPALVEGAVELLAYGLRTSGIEVALDIPGNLPTLVADGDQLHQVLANLVINAQQALHDSPMPRRIAIGARHDAAAQQVVLTVSDNGPGIPDAIRTRIFDPFFTTKPTGIGTGVGLAVSRGIVESHGGTLGMLPRRERGATFEIRLPLGDGAAGPSGIPIVPPEHPAPVARRRALVVDDEAGIAAILSEILLRDGFTCDIAGNGREARALIERVGPDAARYDAILCDLRMADEDGPTFFRWLRQARPELVGRMAFVTGDTLGPAAGRFLEECGRPVVDKPFVPSEIRKLVAQLANGAAAGKVV